MIYPIALAVGTQLVLWVADGPPKIDIEPVCRGIAEQGGVTGKSRGFRLEMDDCRNTESAMLAELVNAWPTFSAADKASCLGQFSGGNASSYTELLTCLEMSRDVRRLHENPEAPLLKSRQ